MEPGRTGGSHGRGVQAPVLALGRGIKFFGAPAGQPRARRATDLVLFVPAIAGVVLAVVAYPPSPLERSFLRFLTALPDWLDPVWGFLEDGLWLWAVVLLVVALVRCRFSIVVQAVASLALAAVVALCAARLALGEWPDLLGALLGTDRAPQFPSVRVAEAATVVVTVSPYLTRPLQRLGRWVLLLGIAGAAIAGGATPVGTIAAFLIAVAAAAGVRLASGTSIGRPGLSAVAAGLAELGVRAHSLEEAERQVAGVFHVRAVDETGEPLLVRVYGRDAYDSQFLARLRRRLFYRGDESAIWLGRLQAAEHEAFVTLLARNGGLATYEVVTAGATIDDDALLVLRGDARSLSSFAPDELDDDVVRDAWKALALLNELRIAHQQIDPETVVVIAGEPGLVDFSLATVAPTAAQMTADRAQLLMTTVGLVGTERALPVALDALGADGLAEVLPYLQSAAFRSSLRQALKEADIDVDDVRRDAALEVGVESPELVKLRRVTPWSMAQVVLLILASNAILTAAANIDWAQVRSSLANASWGWIALAFVVAQIPRTTQAIATLGSVAVRLPFGPVYVMQLATGYMNLALPSNLARMAVNIRFFQRQGLSAPTAVASGVIDSLASTIVQGALLLTLLLFSESSLEVNLPVPSGGVLILLWILVGAVVVSILFVALVPRIRGAVVGNVRRWWPDVRAALGALRASRKLAMLILGNLATEVLFATALGLFARGLGYGISLAELLVINISVSLLASFIPVPGGIGVAEFGLTLGLTSAGMTPEAALAATLLYRVATFYLPPVWGFFSMQWLQRHRYL